jgi:serine/threonine-protein kinase RsbW
MPMVGVDDQRTGVAEGSGVVVLSVPAQAQYIRLARLVGAGMANELNLDLDGLDDVRLAIGEACALAVLDGAAEIHLSYQLAGNQLSVIGDAPTTSGGHHDVDDEQLALVDQILSVACTAHEVSLDTFGLSFRLTFRNAT